MGGYPLIYWFADGGACCAECASGGNGSEAETDANVDEGWHIIGADVFYEGAPEECAHCGTVIGSAYGGPDDDNDNDNDNETKREG